MLVPKFLMAALAVPALAICSDDTQLLQKILERLDHLEKQNQELTAEVQSLRAQLAAAAPTPASSQDEQAALREKTKILEQRTADLDQVKVEASQKFPIRVTGMALFNAFINSHNNGDMQIPEVASSDAGPSTSGASVRQTTLGLSFFGPEAFGAKVSGTVNADFFASPVSGTAYGVGQFVRLRTARLTLDWKNQTASVGVDAPLISPRTPFSLAEVGTPPLSGAGNLWFWQPQLRIEQRFSLGDTMGLRLQGALYETNEIGYMAPTAGTSIEQARPGYEGRFEFWNHRIGGARYEIASGFHLSDSHALQNSIPSRVFSVDWLISPWRKVEWTGTYFDGENLAGIGGIGPGFNVRYGYDSNSYNGYATPVHSTGGWTQLSFLATRRLTFNVFAGQQSNRASDLETGDIGRNFAYAANAIYQLAPNVLMGAEAMQIRTSYTGQGLRLQDRYDLAFGYLF